MIRDTGENEPTGPVKWVVTTEKLNQLNLPTPKLANNRSLTLPFGSGEIAVGILALPPEGVTIPPSQLRIAPRIPFDQARRGSHTPLSTLHEYVVMEDNTRYGIGVTLPRALFTDWSGPKERPEVNQRAFPSRPTGSTEVYRDRQHVGLLIRLNGVTPLVEEKTIHDDYEANRLESFLILSAEPEDKESIYTLVNKRQLSLLDERFIPNGSDTAVTEYERYDLVFNTTSGAVIDNATYDTRGLVEVIVGTCTEDNVIEVKRGPGPFSSGSSYRGAGRFAASQTFGDTTKGETSFMNREVYSPDFLDAKNFRPIGRVRLALVGSV